MRVLVTGGTGFVGACAVAALRRAGHRVRVLARSMSRVEPALGQYGRALLDDVEVAVGDVLDEPAVRRAVSGCDAVVHAAAVYSLDPRRADEMRRTNVRATELVLAEALRERCDPVVHVSSTVALTRFGGSGPDLPLGDVVYPYSISKRESERVARRLQALGEPVVCVYPGAVWGPGDHYLGEQAERLRWLARGVFPLWPPGGFHCVDVRDVAAVLVAVLEPGRGPRQVVVPGHHVDGAALFGALERVQGRRRPRVVLTGRLLRPLASLTGLLQRPLPMRWRYPAEREGIEIALRDTRFDDSVAREELGVQPRDWEQVLADSLQWLVDEGHLGSRYGPRERRATSDGL